MFLDHQWCCCQSIKEGHFLKRDTCGSDPAVGRAGGWVSQKIGRVHTEVESMLEREEAMLSVPVLSERGSQMRSFILTRGAASQWPVASMNRVTTILHVAPWRAVSIVSGTF